jgi:hypothetical protein
LAGHIIVLLHRHHIFSIACLCLASWIIQQAKSAMAHLPYVHLDPSQRLVSLIDLHCIQDVSPYDWSALFDKAITHDDLWPLVFTIGLL